ncbi:MAG: hypothetical protein WC436_04010 [Candidatus Babeliales bacterium]
MKKIQNIIENWPKSFIKDEDLAFLLNKSDDARYSIVKRALKSGLLIKLRRGLYLIASKTKQILPNDFELALNIYGPSFISLESALSYHGWIPEAVYTTTCVTLKRSKEFETPLGVFSYRHVPSDQFYLGVERILISPDIIIFMASPWRALADFIYTRKKNWKNIFELEADLRIENETLIESDQKMLELLIKNYPSQRVRNTFNKLFKNLKNIKK